MGDIEPETKTFLMLAPGASVKGLKQLPQSGGWDRLPGVGY